MTSLILKEDNPLNCLLDLPSGKLNTICLHIYQTLVRGFDRKGHHMLPGIIFSHLSPTFVFLFFSIAISWLLLVLIFQKNQEIFLNCLKRYSFVAQDIKKKFYLLLTSKVGVAKNKVDWVVATLSHPMIKFNAIADWNGTSKLHKNASTIF